MHIMAKGSQNVLKKLHKMHKMDKSLHRLLHNNQNNVHYNSYFLDTVLKLEVTSFQPLCLPFFKPLVQVGCEMRFPITGFSLAHKSPIHLILPFLLELLV